MACEGKIITQLTRMEKVTSVACVALSVFFSRRASAAGEELAGNWEAPFSVQVITLGA
jgi:hypothetical protein